MKEEKLIEVLKKYYNTSIHKGGDILLYSQDAIKLADELRSINIAIMGITGWYYVSVGDMKEKKLAEDMLVDYYVGDNVWFGPNRVEDSVRLVKEYIQTRLPSRTALISFELDISNWEKIYARIQGGKNNKPD